MAHDDIRRNKGSFGSAVETCYFMFDPNNESEADSPEQVVMKQSLIDL